MDTLRRAIHALGVQRALVFMNYQQRLRDTEVGGRIVFFFPELYFFMGFQQRLRDTEVGGGGLISSRNYFPFWAQLGWVMGSLFGCI